MLYEPRMADQQDGGCQGSGQMISRVALSSKRLSSPRQALIRRLHLRAPRLSPVYSTQEVAP